MRYRSLVFILIIATATFAALGQERFLMPVDEADLDPTFAAFRAKLIAAAERKDSAYVLSVTDRHIRVSFGDDAGIADFKRSTKITSPKSWFWKEFLIVLRNGGSWIRENGKRTDSFYAPYPHLSIPDDVVDEDYRVGVVMGKNVNLREWASTKDPVVAKLSYNILRIQPETVPKSGKSEYPDWWHVKTLGGLEGYIRKEYVRGSLDYRAGFEKIRGQWKMTIFIAGD